MWLKYFFYAWELLVLWIIKSLGCWSRTFPSENFRVSSVVNLQSWRVRTIPVARVVVEGNSVASIPVPVLEGYIDDASILIPVPWWGNDEIAAHEESATSALVPVLGPRPTLPSHHQFLSSQRLVALPQFLPYLQKGSAATATGLPILDAVQWICAACSDCYERRLCLMKFFIT